MAGRLGAYQIDSLRSQIADVLADGRMRSARELSDELGKPFDRVRDCLYCGVRDKRFSAAQGRYTLSEFAPALEDAPLVTIRKAKDGEFTGTARQWWQA